MEEYIVVHQFVDRVDNDHQYYPGDHYPRTGEVNKERLECLLSNDIPLIQPAGGTGMIENLKPQEASEISEPEEM